MFEVQHQEHQKQISSTASSRESAKRRCAPGSSGLMTQSNAWMRERCTALPSSTAAKLHGNEKW